MEMVYVAYGIATILALTMCYLAVQADKFYSNNDEEDRVKFVKINLIVAVAFFISVVWALNLA